MLQLEDLLKRPVEIVCDVGYLLVELVEGVASYSPGLARSTSKTWLHSGQVAGMALVPFSLIWR